MENVFKYINKFEEIKLIQSLVEKINENFEIEKKISQNKFSLLVFAYCDMIFNIKIVVRICSLLIIDAMILNCVGEEINLDLVKGIIDFIKRRLFGLIHISSEKIKDILELTKKLCIFKDVHKSIIVDKYFLKKISTYNYPSVELKTYLYKVGCKNIKLLLERLINLMEKIEMDTNQIRNIDINYNIFEFN